MSDFYFTLYISMSAIQGMSKNKWQRRFSPNLSHPLQAEDTKIRLRYLTISLACTIPGPGKVPENLQSLSQTWVTFDSGMQSLTDHPAMILSLSESHFPMLGTKEQLSHGNWLTLSSDRDISRITLQNEDPGRPQTDGDCQIMHMPHAFSST